MLSLLLLPSVGLRGDNCFHQNNNDLLYTRGPQILGSNAWRSEVELM